MCTCLDTNEMLVLRKAKDKLDVNYTILAHKHHQTKIALWVMGLCFLFAAIFNAIFMYLLWFGDK